MPIKEIVNKATRLVASLNKDGTEKPDPESLTAPVGLRKPETIQEQIRRMVRTEASLYASEQGQETFEEADDFDIGDDYDPTSPYEMNFDHENAFIDNENISSSSDTNSNNSNSEFIEENAANTVTDSSANSQESSESAT